MLESKIQRGIINLLEADGWYVIKLMQTNKNGIPDLICHRAGRTIYIEVKRPGEKPRPLQLVRHAQLAAAGIQTYVMTKINIDGIRKNSEVAAHAQQATSWDYLD
jgi:Holliday junction resolvase